MTNTIKIPPHNVPVVDATGNLTPAWRSFFNEQVVSSINTIATKQDAALTTTDTTISDMLLHNS